MINFTFLLRYDETKDVTTGMVRLVMSERAAFEAHMYVQELKTWLPLVNDWIRTGHAYVNRIFRYEKQWRNVGYGRPPAGAPVAHSAPPVAPRDSFIKYFL